MSVGPRAYARPVSPAALPLPTSLSPSKLSSFTSCGLRFRFSAIDGLPEPSSPAACRGTLSTRALERRLRAVWTAVEGACQRGEFRPRPSAACGWCASQRWCPSSGGEPARARVDLAIDERAADGQPPLLHA